MKLLWQKFARSGPTIKIGFGFLGVIIFLGAVWLLLGVIPANTGSAQALGETPSPTPTDQALPELPPLTEANLTSAVLVQGIPRLALLHTTLPDRSRFEVSTYTVEKGDTVFGVAEKFDLKPSTILWSNINVLGDNPHNLSPGQELNILPLDGAYYEWHKDDGLNGVANYFHVKPEDIIDFPGNHLTQESVGDYSAPNIPVGTWLIIPNGQREFISWSAPLIPRSNPAVAKLFGPGACGQVVYGAVGTGTFIFPTTEHWLSGFDYSPGANHPAVDFAGQLGNPVYASDGGVVVYSGWNNWGYGNVIVIDHGTGWQTLYAHLSAIQAGCGQSVSQGEVIGSLGSTGNSSGPHLHFEMMFSGTKMNPHDYLAITGR